MSNTYFKAMSVMGCEIGGITRRSLCRHNCCDGENCVTWLEKQFAKLNEYEDSGLSPEEVQELKEKYETEKTNSEATYTIMCELTEEVERLKKCLAEYEQAKADGRLVVLPCKVGDNVYFLLQELDGEWYVSSPHRTTEIGTRGFWTSAFPLEKPNAMDDFTSWSEFGKTVFLTKEEAEKALEVIRRLSHEEDIFFKYLETSKLPNRDTQEEKQAAIDDAYERFIREKNRKKESL